MVITGDCIDVLATIKTDSVDLLIADLPYDKTPAAHWDCLLPLDELWCEINRICKPTSPILMFAASPFNAQLMMSNYKNFRYEWVWEKNRGTGGLNAKYAPMKVHEFVLVFYRKRGVYNPIKTTGHKPYGGFRDETKKTGRIYGNIKSVHHGSSDGTRYPRSIQKFNIERGFHDTQKPVSLLEYMIKTYSNKGDLVLDPTCGSGSTGVAALNLGRRFIGIEKDPVIAGIARDRIKTRKCSKGPQ